jgi:hypothetical protein
MLKPKIQVPKRFYWSLWLRKCAFRGHYWQTSWAGMTADEFTSAHRTCVDCGAAIEFFALEFRS